ncbi:hypothetical protein CRG98_019232 [Punica granatum]|uniref:Uncharacterized protein n=1 Tax=Punica granatum TaxID=22663 RepID=A0A2I0JWZ5_PUNGR|nr:hypothetical protein CRG98_019232 [Punica granatum]
MSYKPPSCLITRSGNMSVLPKWLRRGTPTIPGHPVIMGPPRFHQATHRNHAGVNSRQKCLHSEKLCSGGAIHWSESPPNAHDVLPRQCDCFEPETGSRTVHPYVNGGDVGLTL